MILKNKWLLASLLFILTTTGLMAQDKYEFATVISLNFGGKADGIYIQYSDKEREFKLAKWDRSFPPQIPDYTPLLKQIQDMSQSGWEIITIEGGTYYLKKKIK